MKRNRYETDINDIKYLQQLLRELLGFILYNKKYCLLIKILKHCNASIYIFMNTETTGSERSICSAYCSVLANLHHPLLTTWRSVLLAASYQVFVELVIT